MKVNYTYLENRFKRVGPNAMKGRGIGTARGRATIMRGTPSSNPPLLPLPHLYTNASLLPSFLPLLLLFVVYSKRYAFSFKLPFIESSLLTHVFLPCAIYSSSWSWRPRRPRHQTMNVEHSARSLSLCFVLTTATSYSLQNEMNVAHSRVSKISFKSCYTACLHQCNPIS